MLVGMVLSFSTLAQAQAQAAGEFWRSTDSITKNRPASDAWVQPEKSHAFTVDPAALRTALEKAPKEFTKEARLVPAEITLPMPDGSSARFRIVQSPVMAPELAALFPEIKTYFGQGIDDPSASARIDSTPEGFHAQILSPNGAVYIDPYWRGNSVLHTSYYKRDYRKGANGFQCLVPEAIVPEELAPAPRDLLRSGNNLRTYRLACAATAEYVQFAGGTVSAGMSAIVTAVNRITGIYEVELAIRFTLVANNHLLVYTNANTDPYSNDNGSAMLGQNQTTIDTVIGSANYDIGHVFSTGGGGLATLGVVCRAGNKARGVTGTSNPTGDAFYVDYVAHEIGHQFGANHTFNSVTGSCSGNRNGSTAYEPGSGSTILSYAGICDADNLQSHSDAYFHSISFDEIVAYSTTGSGGGCPLLSNTGNSAPSVNAGPDYVIPKSTPFILTAIGSDPDGDPLTYCWEQRDLGSSQSVGSADNGSSPIFRSFNPTNSPSRTFPKLSSILGNTTATGEKLPTTSRTLNFRVTARDNRAGGGGVNTDDMLATVVSTAGPFLVTEPNTAVNWTGARTVTWNVAGTATTPINVLAVNILLSTNGGNSFPIVLATNTPNDGSENILLPNITTSLARIKIEAVGNIFFDISDTNFSITPTMNGAFVTLNSSTLTAENCGPTNNAIDPNEGVIVTFSLKNVGTANTTNLVATLLATNGVLSPGSPQAYGVLTTGGVAVARSFSFTAGGICGGTVRPKLLLQDGATDLGSVEIPIPLGSVKTVSTTNSITGSISIPNMGKASPYPSSLSLSGLTGVVTRATVSLVSLSHTFPDDIEALLVAPNNQTVLLMSHTGGGSSITDVALTFDSAASASLPSASTIVSGTYRPTNYGDGSSLPTPAPASPYGTTFNNLNGMNPNGTWGLYVYDSASGDSGNISGGWKLTLVTSTTNCCLGNSPPVISSIPNQVTSEDVPKQINFTIGDAETPPDSLVVSGLSSNTNLIPNTNLVFSGTGTNRTLTVTPATNQFGNTTLTVSVSDGLAITSTAFLLTIDPVNDAPVLDPISPKVVNEGTLLQFTNTAFDVENDQFTFTLDPGAPTGATIHLSTGVFSWVPSEEEGPGVYTITLRVTDNGAPPLSDQKKVTVTVNEVNSAPQLSQPSNQVVYVGASLTFTNSATDEDLPANLLQFNFDLAVVGAQLGATSGVFNWSPTTNQVGTNQFTIRVTDDGNPILSEAKTFSVRVVAPPIIQSVTESNGTITLTWDTIPGRSYRLQFKDDLDQETWDDLGGDVTATAATASRTDENGFTGPRYYRILALP